MSARPQGDPGATSVAGPPRCGTGPAPEGTHAAMARAPKDRIPRAVPTYQAEVIVGGRAAKTTRMETIYHRGQPLRMTAALQDKMETAGWAPEPRVCQQPPGTLPSDTRLHRLLVANLDIQVQVDAPLHAQLWGDHRQESLAQLQRTGVRAPPTCGRQPPRLPPTGTGPAHRRPLS